MRQNIFLSLLFFIPFRVISQSYLNYIPAPNSQGQYGYCDTNGKETIAPMPYRTYFFDFNGTAEISGQKLLKGRIDSTGKIIIPCKFTETVALGDGFTVVRNSEHKGVYDYQGKLIIPFEYDYISLDQNQVFYCSKGNSVSVYFPNSKGKFKKIITRRDIEGVESIFMDGKTTIYLYSDGLTLTYVYSQKGKLIRIENELGSHAHISEDPYPMSDGGPDNEVENLSFPQIMKNSNGYYIGRKSIVHRKIVNDSNHEYTYYEQIIEGFALDSGYFIAKKSGKWGVINPINKVIIPFAFDSICGFKDFFCSRGYLSDREGLIFKVNKNGYWGLINHLKPDSFVVSPKYDDINAMGSCSVLYLHFQNRYGLLFLNYKSAPSIIEPKYLWVFSDEMKYLPNGRRIILVSGPSREFYIDDRGYEYLLK